MYKIVQKIHEKYSIEVLNIDNVIGVTTFQITILMNYHLDLEVLLYIFRKINSLIFCWSSYIYLHILSKWGLLRALKLFHIFNDNRYY